MNSQAPSQPAALADPGDETAPDPRTTAGKIAGLQRRRDEAVHAGSARAVASQHARGKMTARDRIERRLETRYLDEAADSLDDALV